MGVNVKPEPGPIQGPIPGPKAGPEPGPEPGAGRVSAWLDEMIRENAMMDEATRFIRQFLRTGGDAGKGANIAVLGIIAMFYFWFLATMIRFDMSVTIPLEYAELALVTLITPSAIYAAISGEREKATWDALILTRLSPAQIIAGKIAWRIGLVLVIMGVMLIAIMVSQFMGEQVVERVTWPALIAGQAMIFAWGVLLCAFSLWVSAHTKQSVTSISMVVGSLLGALVLLPSLLEMFDLADSGSEKTTQVFGYALVCMNPFLCLWMVTGRHNSSDGPPLPGVPWAFLLAALYLLIAVLFIRSAHTRIRRLEEPVQKG